MNAKYLSKGSTPRTHIIEVTEDLLDLISSVTLSSGVTSGSDLPLHDYLPRAKQYSWALSEFKGALGTLVRLATGGEK